jgi:hypothetical protein
MGEELWEIASLKGTRRCLRSEKRKRLLKGNTKIAAFRDPELSDDKLQSLSVDIFIKQSLFYFIRG